MFELSMSQPKLYGWFHILCLLMTIGLTIILLKLKRNEKNIRLIVGSLSILVMILEVYKQLYYSFNCGQSDIFTYQWNIFPWQFCSTPMYVGLIAAVVRNQKLHYRLCCYLSTYALMAGICVMLYPCSVFTENVLINIQTMVNHGTMVSIGVYLLLSGYIKCELQTLKEAGIVFAVCIYIAIALNEWAYLSGLLEDYPFNMFYISPYVQGGLPVYGTIQQLLPYPLDLMVYIIGFTAGSGMILWIVKRKDVFYEYLSR